MAQDPDNKTRITLGTAGGLITAAGVGIVFPGFKDALLSALESRFQLGLYLDARPLVGATLIVIGVLLLLGAFFGQSRIESAAGKLVGGGITYVICVSYAGPVGSLAAELAIPHLGSSLGATWKTSFTRSAAGLPS